MALPVAQIEHGDGRVELEDATHAAISGSRLYNRDLAPVPIAKRTWNTYNYAALWIGMAHCIPTYLLASGFIALGMAWWQAIGLVAIGNLIVLVPMLLNSHAGTRYGIPFPVLARAAYGVRGSNLPAITRALVACGWFGIQSWIGGGAVQLLLTAIWGGWAKVGMLGGFPATLWVSFLLFWGIQMLLILRGMNAIRLFENWAAPIVLVGALVLLGWALHTAGGLGPIMRTPGKSLPFAVYAGGVVAMIGYWSTLSLNMPDFTRFSRSQRAQVIGQSTALPITMTVFAGIGVMITSATVVIYGSAIWDPLALVSRAVAPSSYATRLVVLVIAALMAIIATISVNVAANTVSPANDFSNAIPRFINFRRGAVITGILGILLQPWRLLSDPHAYIFTWLGGVSAGLGTIAAVIIADYWIYRRRELRLADLYRDDPAGAYFYRNGINWAAVIATLIGFAVAFAGFILNLGWGINIGVLTQLSNYGFFTGGLTSAALYLTFVGPRRDPAPSQPQLAATAE
ncbi:MAG: NCS1 family nucleobase:cation symporter-1 [Candidatus Dormibacteria bacterium]